MSKISLSPDANGTGIFTIASPNSNTNRTLTLPDDTGTIVTNSGNQAGSFTTLNTSGAVVFNDAGADVDFRVEGDTDANLLFVDASTDRVGIGTNSPNRNTEIVASGGPTFGIASSSSGAEILFGRLAFYSTAFSNTYINYGGEIRSYSGSGVDSSDLRFYTGSSSTSVERMRITGVGAIQPTISVTNGGGFGQTESLNTFNNNNVNSIGGVNYGFSIIYISQGNGVTAIPIFTNAGGGVAWSANIFDPDAGTFVNGAGPTVSFVTAGTGGNTYTITMNGGNGVASIQRTAGSGAYTVCVKTIA